MAILRDWMLDTEDSIRNAEADRWLLTRFNLEVEQARELFA